MHVAIVKLYLVITVVAEDNGLSAAKNQFETHIKT
jgi:hypothetical protein